MPSIFHRLVLIPSCRTYHILPSVTELFLSSLKAKTILFVFLSALSRVLTWLPGLHNSSLITIWGTMRKQQVGLWASSLVTLDLGLVPVIHDPSTCSALAHRFSLKQACNPSNCICPRAGCMGMWPAQSHRSHPWFNALLSPSCRSHFFNKEPRFSLCTGPGILGIQSYSFPSSAGNTLATGSPLANLPSGVGFTATPAEEHAASEPCVLWPLHLCFFLRTYVTL